MEEFDDEEDNQREIRPYLGIQLMPMNNSDMAKIYYLFWKC